MAIDRDSLLLLLYAKKRGADFSKVLMLGRQSMNLSKADMDVVRSVSGMDLPEAMLQEPYSEPLLRHLGAVEVDSMDASAYEGATVLHDLNEPVGMDFSERYTLIYDGGTLEHVFHFPQAIMNVIRMLKEGSTFLSVSPANNFLGHGFYQFSPELFFRIFSEQNGFEPPTIVLSEKYAGKAGLGWFQAEDPARLRRRGVLCNYRETQMLTMARKIRQGAVELAQLPQQSDYSAQWAPGSGLERFSESSKQRGLFQAVLGRWKHVFSSSALGVLGKRRLKRPYFAEFRPFTKGI